MLEAYMRSLIQDQPVCILVDSTPSRRFLGDHGNITAVMAQSPFMEHPILLDVHMTPPQSTAQAERYNIAATLFRYKISAHNLIGIMSDGCAAVRAASRWLVGAPDRTVAQNSHLWQQAAADAVDKLPALVPGVLNSAALSSYRAIASRSNSQALRCTCHAVDLLISAAFNCVPAVNDLFELLRRLFRRKAQGSLFPVYKATALGNPTNLTFSSVRWASRVKTAAFVVAHTDDLIRTATAARPSIRAAPARKRKRNATDPPTSKAIYRTHVDALLNLLSDVALMTALQALVTLCDPWAAFLRDGQTDTPRSLVLGNLMQDLSLSDPAFDGADWCMRLRHGIAAVRDRCAEAEPAAGHSSPDAVCDQLADAFDIIGRKIEDNLLPMRSVVAAQYCITNVTPRGVLQLMGPISRRIALEGLLQLRPLDLVATEESLGAEVDRWMQDDALRIAASSFPSVREWWASPSAKRQLPQLAPAASRVLGAAIHNAACERVFSTLTHLESNTARFSSMRPDTLRGELLLRGNTRICEQLRQEFFNRQLQASTAVSTPSPSGSRRSMPTPSPSHRRQTTLHQVWSPESLLQRSPRPRSSTSAPNTGAPTRDRSPLPPGTLTRRQLQNLPALEGEVLFRQHGGSSCAAAVLSTVLRTTFTVRQASALAALHEIGVRVTPGALSTVHQRVNLAFLPEHNGAMSLPAWNAQLRQHSQQFERQCGAPGSGPRGLPLESVVFALNACGATITLLHHGDGSLRDLANRMSLRDVRAAIILTSQHFSAFCQIRPRSTEGSSWILSNSLHSDAVVSEEWTERSVMANLRNMAMQFDDPTRRNDYVVLVHQDDSVLDDLQRTGVHHVLARIEAAAVGHVDQFVTLAGATSD